MKKAIKRSAGPTNRSGLINPDGRMPRGPGTATAAPGTAAVALSVGGVTAGGP
jgi:hypothetical protein